MIIAGLAFMLIVVEESLFFKWQVEKNEINLHHGFVITGTYYY